MSKKKSKLQQAQDEAQAAINETNKKIEELAVYIVIIVLSYLKLFM